MPKAGFFDFEFFLIDIYFYFRRHCSKLGNSLKSTQLTKINRIYKSAHRPGGGSKVDHLNEFTDESTIS